MQRRCLSISADFAAVLAMCWVMLAARPVVAQTPVLETVFPAGGQVGQMVDVTIGGSSLEKVLSFRCNVSGVRCEQLAANRFRLAIPANTPPGLYDLWAVGEQGVSGPRTFAIGNRAEQLEIEPNDSATVIATAIPLDVVLNGRIEKPGDVDQFRFAAKRGQRVVIECWAERIDSRLRAVLELFDTTGQRLAVNRGYFGIDPLIDFRVPADGSYVVKVQDLTSTGSAEHYYRLDIDTGPRIAFSVPSVIQRGQAARVAFFGWNLPGASQPTPSSDRANFDRVEVEFPAALAHDSWPLPVRLHPSQTVLDGLAYHFPGSHASLVNGLTDVPVIADLSDNHTPSSAQEIAAPCEICGQLVAGDERDWFTIQARRGETFYLEALAQRMHSPVDLQLRVLDASGQQELAQFGDEPQSNNSAFPTDHLDPAGRWVAPSDGRFLIVVQNLIGGLHDDPRRTYRLSVRREEPDFQLVVVPQRREPAALNVRRGGREVVELLAFRRRGYSGGIRVAAQDLPVGVECPDVWLGPGVDRTLAVVSADRNTAVVVDELKLAGFAEGIGRREARPATVVRAGTPNVWGRLTSQMPLAVAGDAPIRITADAHETIEHPLYGKLKARHSPGGVVDVAVHIERRDTGHQAAVKLIGVGLPDTIANPTAIVPAGESKGYLSFYLPPTLAVGRYSFVIRAETTVPTVDPKQPETVVAFSNPVTIDVQPAAFLVEVDPFAVTRAKRGEVIQIGYAVQRRNGFIGKLHTELASPGRVTNVVGLRGRGETFVGQVDKGTLQIIVNDDAPLGRQPFLRLFTVGVLEDEPLFHGSSILSLEIVE